MLLSRNTLAKSSDMPSTPCWVQLKNLIQTIHTPPGCCPSIGEWTQVLVRVAYLDPHIICLETCALLTSRRWHLSTRMPGCVSKTRCMRQAVNVRKGKVIPMFSTARPKVAELRSLELDDASAYWHTLRCDADSTLEEEGWSRWKV